MTISETPWPYSDHGTALTGLLYRDEAVREGPGLLLVPGGAGLDDDARAQARRYAGLGYTVLACDVWGPDVRGRDQIIACLTALRDDPAALARRAGAGLAALASLPESGPALAAVGFCFGGMAVLTLARTGEPLRGVVSVHGNLTTTAPATPGAVRARVLVCHGSRDPHVPPADVAAFAEEMDQASADWELVMFGGAEHGFTHATASPGATPGVAYDPRADHRSFAIIRQFLAEVTPD